MTPQKRPAEAPAAAAPAPEAEEDFPRGGGGALSALQRRQAREEGAAEAAHDLDAGAGGRSRGKKRQRRGAAPGEEDGEDLFYAREALQGKLPKYVELLKFKVGWTMAYIWGLSGISVQMQACCAYLLAYTWEAALAAVSGRCCILQELSTAVLVQSLSPGAKVWGAVAEVGPRELIISLPHGLKGHVPAAEVIRAPMHTDAPQGNLPHGCPQAIVLRSSSGC